MPQPLNILILALLAAVTLSACQVQDSAGRSPITATEAFAALDIARRDYYEALPENTKGESRFNALILLTRYYAASGDLQQAAARLTELEGLAANTLQEQELTVVRADLAALQGDNQRAARYLNAVHALLLPGQAAAFFYNLSARVYETLFSSEPDDANYTAAFSAYRHLIPLVNAEAGRTVAKRALRLVQTRSPQTLAQALSASQDFVEKGFYQYAIIDRTANRAIRQRLLTGFKEDYAGHILTSLIDGEQPADQQAAPAAAHAEITLAQGDRIAVLLPQSGRFRDIVGTPAKLGILAAIQDRKARLEVIFYDTNRRNIQDIVNLLTGDGTRFVIGPILKPEVDALILSSNRLPSIVFNTTGQQMPENMFYFDLGPNFEGMSAADRIADDGHSQVIVTQGSSVRQRRVYDGFLSQAGRRGLQVTACEYIDLKTVRADLGKCAFAQADAVYLNGTAQEANAIRTLLREGLPIYLSSSSYSGVNQSGLEISMARSGALLGDMPWLLSESTMKDAFMRNIPKADAQAQRIFAAGYDSISVALNLARLAQGNTNIIHGLSGDITLRGNLIWNKPLWVKLGEKR